MCAVLHDEVCTSVLETGDSYHKWYETDFGGVPEANGSFI